MENEPKDLHFLVHVQQQADMAWMALGKQANPMTNETSVNLDAARFCIGFLEMLDRKTSGNLDDEESALLKSSLTNLRLNFLDVQQAEKQAEAPSVAPEEAEDASEDSEDSPKE